MIKISLLGYPLFRQDNRKINLSRKKTCALISYLADTDRDVPRNKLAFLLWPQAPLSDGRTSLRTVLSDSARNFGQDFIQKNDDCLKLNASVVHSDTTIFRHSLEDLKNPKAMSEAEALWRGGFLKGFDLPRCPEFSEWLRLEEQNFLVIYGKLTKKLTEALAAERKYPEALTYGRKLLQLDPFDEEYHRAVMTFHAATGNYEAALNQYKECRELIQEEFGFPPEEETRLLADKIKSGKKADQTAGNKIYTMGDPHSRRIAILGFSAPLKLQIEFPDITDILTYSLREEFSSAGNLIVLAPSYSLPFRNEEKSLIQTAREMPADYLIEGKIEESDNRIIIKASLFRAAGAEMIPLEPITLRPSREFILAGGIGLGRDVIKRIAGRGDSPKKEEAVETPDPNSLYKLRAQQLMMSDNPEELKQAEELLKKCIESVPSDAGALALLAQAYNYQSSLGILGKDTEGLMSKAKATARKALHLNPEEPTALWIFGQALEEMEKDFSGAEEYFLKSFRLNPGNGDMLSAFSQNLLVQGEFKRALEMVNRSIELDPVNGWAYSIKHWILIAMGRYRQVLDVLEELEILFPNPVRNKFSRGLVHFLAGRYSEGTEIIEPILEELIENDMGALGAMLAYGYGSLGETEKAEALIRKFSRDRESFIGFHMPFAAAYAVMGKLKEAMIWLERAVEAKDPGLSFLVMTPFYEPLYDYPPYDALLKKINLINRKNLNF